LHDLYNKNNGINNKGSNQSQLNPDFSSTTSRTGVGIGSGVLVLTSAIAAGVTSAIGVALGGSTMTMSSSFSKTTSGTIAAAATVAAAATMGTSAVGVSITIGAGLIG
jgi:hypothetical protein